MPKASPIRSTFNAGELSPLMDGRVDVAKYNNGCRVLENFIPSVQGPAIRRAGTRFVSEVKDSTKQTWLARFEFNVTQAYVLEFGHQYIRFYTQHGVLLSGGLPYEIATPYSSSDLTDSDGTFTLDMVQSGDIIYIAHPNYPTQKLSRYGNTNWTIAPVTFTNGPFKDQNGDRTLTISASGTSGTITLTASSSIFTANHVGSYLYLEPVDLSTIKPWYAGQEFTTNPVGIYRRSDGKTYKCVTNGTPTAGKVWRTGGDKPVHTYGIQADGDYSSRSGTTSERDGLDWQFVDSGFGYVKITGYTSGTQVTAVVQGVNPLPFGVVVTALSGTTTNGANTVTGISSTANLVVGMSVTGSGIPANTFISTITSSTAITLTNNATASATVSITYGTATFRWAMGAFSAVEGYPSKVTFFRERLTLCRGQQIFCSVAGDFENFSSVNDSGQVVADRSIQVTISSDEVNKVQWLVPTQALLIGTAGCEFACSENSSSEAFAPANVKIEQQTSDGSRGVKPVRVGYSALFVQRSGRKLKEASYQFQQNGYVTNDLSVLAEHITIGGITQMTWHKEPYVALWAVRGDGVLLGFTFNKEQDVTGWHKHTLGGNGIVESVTVIPAPDKGRDELWMIVRRTINGSTKRYVEYLEREYRDGDTQASAFYVDCGLTYSGSPATTISGLSHLEGKTVQILADGATHPDRVVTSGAITLQLSASVVNIGLAYDSTLQTNRIEAGAGDGTAQGKTKRINKVVARFYNTLGAKVGPNASSLDEIQFRTGSDHMDAPPPLFTGDKLVEFPSGYDFDGYVMVKQTQPLPMTVVALMPQLHTFDR